jgi:predicted TIM-barrel fold metal-dependent hydrolase
VAAVVEVARAHRVPVIIASGYPWLSEALQVADLVQQFPDVRFLATNGIQINMSGLGQTDAELALAANDNLSITTTGVYREDFIRRVVERHGAGRVLFASAYPHFDPRLEILRVEWAGFDEKDRGAMVGGNAEALFRR